MFVLKDKLMDEAVADDASNGDATGGNPSNVSSDNSGNWRDTLSEDLRNNDSLSKFTDINALAKSYVNAESMIGKDKIVLPTTEDEWNEAYNKLGRPEDASGYELTLPEGVQGDDPVLGGFKDTAYELGLNKNQTAKLAEWYFNTQQKAVDEVKANINNSYDEASQQLKSQWGERYEQNLEMANRALSEFGGDELIEKLGALGLDNDPGVVQFLFNVSQKTLEQGGLQNSGNSGDSLDPSQLQDKINELMTNPAYVNKMDPNHSSTVDKVQKLFGRLHGAR